MPHTPPTDTHTHYPTQRILNHPWINLSEDEKLELGIVSSLPSQSPITARKSGVTIDVGNGSPVSSLQRDISTGSPLPGSPDDTEFGLTRSNTMHSHVTINDADDNAVDQEFIKSMYHNQSARERKVYEDFNHDKTDVEKVHLPPIEPQTPNVGQARKILLRGADLANKLSNQSPAVTPVTSPAPGHSWRHDAPQNSPQRDANRLGGSHGSSTFNSPMSSSVSSPDIRTASNGHGTGLLQLEVPSGNMLSKIMGGSPTIVSPLIQSKAQYSISNSLNPSESLPLITEQNDNEKDEEEKSLLSGRGSVGSKSYSDFKGEAKEEGGTGAGHGGERKSSRGQIDIGESKSGAGSRRGGESRIPVDRESRDGLDVSATSSPNNAQAEGKSADSDPPPYTQKA